MNLKRTFIWTSYFVIVSYLVFRRAYAFFVPGEDINLYFRLLYAFDKLTIIHYFVNFNQIILNILHLLPLLLYTFRKRWLDADYWKYLLIFRAIFDILGNSYELNYLSSLYIYNKELFIAVLISTILPYLPSYLACYRYAFINDKLEKI